MSFFYYVPYKHIIISDLKYFYKLKLKNITLAWTGSIYRAFSNLLK